MQRRVPRRAISSMRAGDVLVGELFFSGAVLHAAPRDAGPRTAQSAWCRLCRDHSCERAQRALRKKLKRTLSSTFLVATAQTVELLPQAKLDDGHRHAGAGDHRLDGA